jgi:hypothetical protein
MLGKVDDNNKVLRKIMFSDEAIFDILGKIMYAFGDENILVLQYRTLGTETKLMYAVSCYIIF